MTLIILSACDDSEAPLQAPELLEASHWSEVYFKRTCATSDGTTPCLGQNGFHVDGEGQASIGPEFGPVEPSGLLTPEEQNAVVSAANAITDQESGALTWSCEPWFPSPGENGVLLRLHDESNQSQTYYQKSLTMLQVCYRGDRGLAEALYQVVNPLVDRYGVVPTPTPTPTGTGTGTGTPTPTPPSTFGA